MTVIKAADRTAGSQVQALGVRAPRQPPKPPQPSPIEMELASSRTELASALDSLSRLEGEAEVLRKKAGESFAAGLGKGREEGRAEGLKQAQDDSAQRTTVLKEAADRAVSRFTDELLSLERLAPAVALAALERVLGSPGKRGELVVELARRHLDAVAGQGVVRLEASRKDFDDADLRAELSRAVGSVGAELRMADDLPSGACRIRLQLGRLDVGLDQQWPKLSQLLGEMAEPAG